MDISILLLSFSLSIFFIIMLQKFFIKYDLVDDINKRSSHNVIATRSGGLGLLLTIFIISSYHYFLGDTIYDFSIIVPIGLLAVVGLYDDIYKVDFKLKFIFQIIAAKIIIDNGYIIEDMHGVFGIFELNRMIAQLLTMLIIVAVLNAINFIDGIDGLAITIVSIFIILFEFFSKNGTPFINFSSLVIICLLPLYYFNFKKSNKVFLGDSGSLLLGTVSSIYIIHIMTNDYVIKDNYDLHKILFVISIFVYPITDLTRVFFLRIISGKSPFIADKRHIHHLIFKKVKNHFLTVIIISLITLLAALLIQITF
jgi:UDP-GlcNAc:undecaprenyl-phosphate/decaprenyl-phosphate GlcNAc-1-phosphate transferase